MPARLRVRLRRLNARAPQHAVCQWRRRLPPADRPAASVASERRAQRAARRRCQHGCAGAAGVCTRECRSLQSANGAVGFRPSTARLRLRRPRGRRSAARGADASPVARAPQAFERASATSCQAPFGAIGFRLLTARLRLRRPSDARSAERGRYNLCSTSSSRDGVECVLCGPRGGHARSGACCVSRAACRELSLA